jgi:hypothetical protein
VPRTWQFAAAFAKDAPMICHPYRCIFIHVPKCAGQSIERVFLEAVGLDWDSRAPLLLRRNDKPELGPPRLAHLTAEEYVTCKHVSPQQFASYFKFAIVRNPWDRMVSFYKYLGFDRRTDFKQFVTKYFMHQLWTNKYWFVRPQCEFIYNDDGECLVDYVGRFELLSAAMDHVGRSVGLGNVSIVRTNKSSIKFQPQGGGIRDLYRHAVFKVVKKRSAKRHDYRAYYDEESVLQVAKIYKRDIEAFDYRFDPSHEDHPDTRAMMR